MRTTCPSDWIGGGADGGAGCGIGSALFCGWSKAPSSAANRAGISPAFWAKVKRPSGSEQGKKKQGAKAARAPAAAPLRLALEARGGLDARGGAGRSPLAPAAAARGRRRASARLRRPPAERRLGVLRTQRPVLMKGLSDEEVFRYTEAPRAQAVGWLNQGLLAR